MYATFCNFKSVSDVTITPIQQEYQKLGIDSVNMKNISRKHYGSNTGEFTNAIHDTLMYGFKEMNTKIQNIIEMLLQSSIVIKEYDIDKDLIIKIEDREKLIDSTPSRVDKCSTYEIYIADNREKILADSIFKKSSNVKNSIVIYSSTGTNTDLVRELKKDTINEIMSNPTTYSSGSMYICANRGIHKCVSAAVNLRKMFFSATSIYDASFEPMKLHKANTAMSNASYKVETTATQRIGDLTFTQEKFISAEGGKIAELNVAPQYKNVIGSEIARLLSSKDIGREHICILTEHHLIVLKKTTTKDISNKISVLEKLDSSMFKRVESTSKMDINSNEIHDLVDSIRRYYGLSLTDLVKNKKVNIISLDKNRLIEISLEDKDTRNMKLNSAIQKFLI